MWVKTKRLSCKYFLGKNLLKWSFVYLAKLCGRFHFNSSCFWTARNLLKSAYLSSLFSETSFSWVFLLGCISRRKSIWVLWIVSLTSISGFSITGEISISSAPGYPFLISVLTKGCIWGNLYIWIHTTFFNCRTLCKLHLS